MNKLLLGIFLLLISVEIHAQSVTYNGPGFIENVENNGTLSGRLTATLEGAQFVDEDNEVSNNIAITNLPDGLTVNATVETIVSPYWEEVSNLPSGKFIEVIYENGQFVAVVSGGDTNIATSPDGINWTSQNTPAGNGWNHITYGNGLYVASRTSTTVNKMISTDAINWTLVDTGDFFGASDITFGNGLFVEVAWTPSNGPVRTSPDGINWTPREVAEYAPWRTVTYGNGIFVALASNSGSNTPRVMTSQDGVAWVLREASIEGDWNDIIYADSKFIAFGDGGVAMYSTDGINWITIDNIPNNLRIRSIAYGEGNFVGVGSNGTTSSSIYQVLTSSNGIDWNLAASSQAQFWNSIAYGANKFIAVNNTATDNGFDHFMMTSSLVDEASITLTGSSINNEDENDIDNLLISFTDGAFDGVEATAIENATGPASTNRSINFMDAPSVSISETGYYENEENDGSVRGNIKVELQGDSFSKSELVLGEDYLFSPIPNGLSPTFQVQLGANDWRPAEAVAETSWTAVAYGNGIYVAIALDFNGNAIMKSEDGISWELVPYNGNIRLFDIVYAAGKFVAVGAAVGQNEKILTSTNGTNWTEQEAVGGVWGTIAYGDEKFVALNGQSSATVGVVTSPDGTVWTPRETAESIGWRSLAYGNGIFVAVANDGDNRIMTSSDGIVWSSVQAPELNDWTSITYGNGIFVAVSRTGDNRVMTSIDGINWTPRQDTGGGSWSSVTYGDGLFVAVGTSGSKRVMTSVNGVDWVDQPNFVASIWSDVTYGNGKFVAVAQDGTNQIMVASSLSIATLKLNGNAADHEDIHDQSDFVFQMNDSAFTTSEASMVVNAEEPLTTNFGIDFLDAPSIIYSGSGFIETSENTGAVSGSMIIDIDGETFKSGNLSSGVDFEIENLPAGLVPEMDVAVAGSDWELGFAASPIQWESIIYGNGQYVAVASGPSMIGMTSPDGLDWTLRVVAADSDWSSIAYGNERYVAVARQGETRIMVSEDGINWEGINAPQQNSWESITFGNGFFVAVASDGTNRVIRSANGINWELYSSSEQNSWSSITFGEQGFIAVAKDGTNRIMQSSNGISWVSRMAPEINIWESVIYGTDRYVGISSDGTNQIMYSTNGISWESASAPEINNWRDIAYGAGTFVAISNDGDHMVMNSVNGIDWSVQEEAIINSWESITYGSGSFAAVARLNGTGTGAMVSRASTQAVLTLTGAASNNENTDDVDNLQFEFSDSAFNVVSATNIQNATGPASTEIGIDFMDEECTLIIDCPDNFTVTIEENQDYFIGNIFEEQSVSIENCNTNITLAQEPLEGAELQLGENMVTLTVESENGETVSCSFTLTVEETLGIEERKITDIKIYPIPSKDFFYFENLFDLNIDRISLFSITGKELGDLDLTENKIDISKYSSGIYFVKINTESESHILRLIKR